MTHPIGRQIGDPPSPEASDAAAAQLRTTSGPLASPEDLDPLLERIGDCRYVLLGEASRGTSEFHTWRSRVTGRLILEKGFSFVAVEGDWPDCYRVNRYVKGRDGGGDVAEEVLRGFSRWPAWMWANREMERFAEWLRFHNSTRGEDVRVGFYGLDVYSRWESTAAIVEHLDRVDPVAARRARHGYECFAAFGADEAEDARTALPSLASCEDEVVRLLSVLRRGAPRYSRDGAESYFETRENALAVKDAESYYRTMIRGGAASWNVRELHMADILDRLVGFHGGEAKVIVWGHDAHVGDLRHTTMAARGFLNLGQCVRERHEREGVVIVGFSTHGGTVSASDAWGAPVERKRLPEAREESWEDVLHRLGHDSLVMLSGAHAPAALLEPRGHRAIGVVYHPEHEHADDYVPTVLPLRYDALLFCDSTHALESLPRDEPEPTWKSAQAHETAQCRDGAASAPARLESV